MALVELDGRPTVGEAFGFSVGIGAWSLDGAALAWCEKSDATHVVALGSDSSTLVPGCDPRFSDEGRLLTRNLGPPSRTLYRSGEIYIDEALIEAVLPEATGSLVRIVGYDVGASGLVALLVSVAGAVDLAHVLQLWRERTLESSIVVEASTRDALGPVAADLGGTADRVVRLSPDEREVITGPVVAGAELLLIDLHTHRRTTLEPQFGFDWSPDGVWLALSTSEEVLVLGAERTQPIFRLPISANALAWRE